MSRLNGPSLRLVLLVSCCHALVHVYENSFATVEQLVAADFGVGTEVTGTLGSALRLPFGLFALATGWIADRLGAKRLLLLYLAGCSGACLLAFLSVDLALLFAAMFALGTFCSIYHPAGTGLISLHTIPSNRPMALGYHGIFGSAGIAAGPFLAALVLSLGVSWRGFFLLLTVPGLLLAVLLHFRLHHESENLSLEGIKELDGGTPIDPEDGAHWPSFALLLALGSMAGFVYAAILTFLPRYLDGADIHFLDLPPGSVRNYLTSGVLLLGILGQYTAGRIARAHWLEPMLAVALFGATPCVLWMGFAQGAARLWAAALFAPLFFMHQPLFNSLVAKYVPRRRRSFCYGLSFTMGFGVGSFGPVFAGLIDSDVLTYSILAAVLATAATLALVLGRGQALPNPDAPRS